MMDEILCGGAHGGREAEGGGEPLGEGSDVGAEEGVDGVGEAVVLTESSTGDTHQAQARPQCVDHVRTGPRHGELGPVMDLVIGGAEWSSV